MKTYEKEGYRYTEYKNGTIVKSIIQEPVEQQEELTEPIIQQKTTDEKLANLEQQNLDLMDAIATLFELMGGA